MSAFKSNTAQIRSTFIDYFVEAGHEAVASSPLVPRNDPTLMFVNAGMVQFKNLFTGIETRPYSRAVTSQKCVRAGGKHNDLENVGRTARHHTFFEMLGNFSFGDYFKDVAIELAWNLVTREFGLDPARLLVTVFSEDDDAAALWRKIAGLGEDRILRIPTSDNFWAMGDTGPCGPCSEIFYDHGPQIQGGPPGSPDEDGDRFVEIWNLVFMQFEQRAPDDRRNLPRPSIDTGMGLERIAAVLQGKHDNYDIDLMRRLIEASADVTGSDPDGPHRVAHRIIADHLRASSFLIADGVLPSNEGRGYVLRRIMRRAMRHLHLIGGQEPLMWKLVPTLVAEMGEAFGELHRAEALIAETLRGEEARFKTTLERGLRLLDDAVDGLEAEAPLPGQVAFRLYDTYGFPLDLTEDVLRQRGLTVDRAAFDAAMERQRAEARANWQGSGDLNADVLWFDIEDRVGATDFLGYETEVAAAVIVALVASGSEVETARTGDAVTVVVNQTPFYGESGGQVGDRGWIVAGDDLRLEVEDTAKVGRGLFAHRGTVRSGTAKVGLAVELSVDGDRRAAIRGNHSATHLVHAALRRRLGQHVAQKGSLVAPDRLRFDISHPVAVGTEDLRAIEAEVNDRIRENAEVVTRLMTPDDAVAEGAMALFGEKYGETVRVVAMGREGNGPYSLELCGGTHVARTGDIGAFRLVGEGAVAAGVRRIEAVTGATAISLSVEREAILDRIAAQLRSPVAELPRRVAAVMEERKALEREVADLRRKLAGAGGEGGGPRIKSVAGVDFSGQVLEGVKARDLKSMADELKARLGSGIVALIARDGGKASVVVGVTTDLTARHDAVGLVRVAADALGGKGGGGRPDLAQAGGPDGSLAEEAIAKIEAAIAGR